ncbi:MAG: chemotaxis protein CheX [Cellulosilyticum sp.]|nr:chemotaxis protein CheX [Cellulosilyticum sp.]
MNAEYINLFISAVTQVYEETIQTTLLIGDKSIRTGSAYSKNVVVLIGLTGKVRGSVTVSMDEEYAKEVASKMMFGMPVEVFDEMPQSAIREMTNMTMGRVASLFEQMGIGIDITPPTLMTGESIRISNEISPTLVLGFNDGANENVIELDISIMDVK